MQRNMAGWGFILPVLVLMLVFLVYPVVWSLWMSMQVGTGMRTEFGGTENLRRLMQDGVFFTALKNTMIYLVIQVPIMTVLGLLLASMLNNPKLKYRGLFRTLIFLPAVTSLVAYSVLFKGMFALDGVINSSLMALHIVDSPIEWFNDPFWSRTLIIIAITWRWTGYNMIFYLAAMQNIDNSIYEAARIDGVSPRNQFLKITIPLLAPVILFTSVMSTIGTLQIFDEVKNLTSGGPGDATLSLSLYIYNLVFAFAPKFGYAATVSYTVVAIMAALAVVQFWIGREKD